MNEVSTAMSAWPYRLTLSTRLAGTSLGITAVIHGRPTGRRYRSRWYGFIRGPDCTIRARAASTMKTGTGPPCASARPEPFYWHMTSRWQAVPGPWTFEVRYDGRTLARHTFMVER